MKVGEGVCPSVWLVSLMGPVFISHCPYLVSGCHDDPPSWLYTTKSCALSVALQSVYIKCLSSYCVNILNSEYIHLAFLIE